MNKDQKELELKLDLSKVGNQNNISNKKEIKEINTTSKKKKTKKIIINSFFHKFKFNNRKNITSNIKKAFSI